MKRLLWMIVALVLFITPCLAAEETELKIGGKIETSFLTMTLKKFDKLDKLKFTKKETGSLENTLSKTDSSATYIAIKGEITNTAKEGYPLSNAIRGVAIIDGYQYQLEIFSPDFFLEPLTTKAYYLYALVPNKLAKSFKSCEFKIGMFEDYVSNWYNYDESLEYDYRYTINLK